MNVTVGKLRPLSRMVNPVWRAFMPISKWSQHDALASELTTTGSQNLPECLLPCLTGSNNVPLQRTLGAESKMLNLERRRLRLSVEAQFAPGPRKPLKAIPIAFD
jgi:hypothetical protein